MQKSVIGIMVKHIQFIRVKKTETCNIEHLDLRAVEKREVDMSSIIMHLYNLNNLIDQLVISPVL